MDCAKGLAKKDTVPLFVIVTRLKPFVAKFIIPVPSASESAAKFKSVILVMPVAVAAAVVISVPSEKIN